MLTFLTYACLPHSQLIEIRLRLAGAFDRLLKSSSTSDPFILTQNLALQLQKVIESCLKDLELKLKSIALNPNSSNLDHQRVRGFLSQLTEQTALIDIEQLLLNIIAKVRETKVNHGLTIMRQLMTKKKEGDLRKAWKAISQQGQGERKIKMIVKRQESKKMFGSINKVFQQWKDSTGQEPGKETLKMLELYATFFKQTITNQNITKISNFFDSCKQFLKECLELDQNQYVDLIFLNKQNQALTFIQAEENNPDEQDHDRERLIDLSQKSLLRSFINKSSSNAKFQYFANVTQKQQFNTGIDVPYINMSEYESSLNQLHIGLFVTYQQHLLKDKKLKFVVRITSKNDELSQLSLQQKLAAKLIKVESLLIQSFKVFRKLHYQFKNFNNKLGDICTTSIDKATLGQLQYLQQKSLELSCVSNIKECINLINTVVRELYNYEKTTVLQYHQGLIYKFDIQSTQEVESINLIEEVRHTNLVRDLISQQIAHGQNSQNSSLLNSARSDLCVQHYIRQDCVEDQKPNFEQLVKNATDIVVVSLDLKPQHSQLEVSAIYQLTTDAGINGGTQSLIQTQSQLPKYFLRIEKKIGKKNESESFTAKNESFVVLKSFIQLILISINKMKIIQQQREQQNIKIMEAVQSRTLISQGNAEQEMTRINEQNDQLKRLLQIQRVIDEFLDELKQQNQSLNNNQTGLLYFEDFHLKLLSFLHVLIPNCKRMQLFLSKDPQGQVFYTYVNQANQISNETDLNATVINAHLDTTLLNPPHNSTFNRPKSQSRVADDLKSRNNQNVFAQTQVNQQNIMQQQQQQHFYTNFQQIMVPSQMDEISSISPNDHTHINVQNVEKISGGTNTTQDHIFPGKQQYNQPITHQPSRFNLQGSSSSFNLNQNPHQTKMATLHRDYSAQTELNGKPQNNVAPPSNMLILQNFGNTSPSDSNSKKTPLLDASRLAPPINDQRLLTSFDTVFHSQLNDESEIDDIHAQDPQKVRRVEFKVYGQQKSIMAEALREGLIKRNAKNDKKFNAQIDNIIYSQNNAGGGGGSSKRQKLIENAIYMPMANSRGQIVGMVQIANSAKQLLFNEQDMEVARLVAFKIANFITDARDTQRKRVMFKKQVEYNVLSQNLENQSVKKVLSLANKLFQKEHNQPLFAVGYFIKKTEKYLRETFNCMQSQVLLVDHSKQLIFSFDVQDKHARILKRGEIQSDYSLTNALIKGNFQEPIIWPGTAESGTPLDDNLSDPGSRLVPSHQGFYSQFINYCIDCPLNYLTQDMPSTYLSMTVRDLNDQQRVLGIVQLLSRSGNIPFTEHDIAHLSLLCLHLSQVLTHISNHGLLSLLTPQQTNKLTGLFKLLQRKHKGHQKHFLRELLQYQYGKVNLLKNKIMRKYMDKHMKIDGRLKDKIQKIMEIREKCQLQRKQEVIGQLKRKTQALQQKRITNAKKCLEVVSKYEKLIGIRVKDTVFRFWDRLRKEGININSEESREALSPTFMRGQSQTILIQDQSYSSIETANNNSSFLEESSITSVIYLKAKAVYKIKKLFNEHKLQVHFNCFLIKSFHLNYRNFLYNLEGIRLLKLHHIVSRTVRRLNEYFFNALYSNCQQKSLQYRTLHKIASKRVIRDMSFGMKQWQNYTERSMKKEMKIDKTQLCQLVEISKEASILQSMMTGLNQIFSQFKFSSVDECIQSSSIKLFFANLAEQITELTQSKAKDSQIVFTFRLPENYCLTEGGQQLFLMFVMPDSSDRLTINSSNIDKPRESIYFNHHSSVSENGFGSNIVQDIITGPFIKVFDGSKDCIINQLTQMLSPLIYSKNATSELDPTHELIYPSLKLRAATEQQKALFVPMFDQMQSQNSIQSSLSGPTLFGTLEIYSKNITGSLHNRKNRPSEHEDPSLSLSTFSQDEQARFRQQASVLYIGLEALSQRLSLIHSLYLMNSSSGDPRNSLVSHDYFQPQTKSPSSLIHSLTIRIKSLFNADHCVLVFVPLSIQLPVEGLFYHFQSGQLFSLTLNSTLFEDLLLQQTPTLTFASSSLSRYESITGELYTSLKYLTAVSSDDLTVFVELGWNNGYNIDEEYTENKAVRIVQEEVDRIQRDIRKFNRVVGRKIEQREAWKRATFQRWRELSYIPKMFKESRSPIRSTPKVQHMRYQSIGGESEQSPAFRARGRSSIVRQIACPHSHIRNATQNERHSHKRSMSQDNAKIKRRARSSISRSCSQVSNEYEIAQVDHQDQTEIEVERAAKRKLVSAALLMISIQSRVYKKLQLQQALNEWKSFQYTTQITEGAFNKLLELNHRHSTTRFSLASYKLTNLLRRKLAPDFFVAISSLQQLPFLYNKRNRSLSPTHHLFQNNGLSSIGSQRQSQVKRQRYVEQINDSPQEIIKAVDLNDTRQFEEEVFAIKEVKQSQANSMAKRSPIKMLQQYKSEEEIQSEFSLGTGNGTKAFQFMNNFRLESGVGSEQKNSLKPPPVQQNHLYQNFFKRI